jgi:hypothetical protein
MHALLPLRHLRLTLRSTQKERTVTAIAPPPPPVVVDDPRGPVLYDLLEM